MKKRAAPVRRGGENQNLLFTLEIFILEGPMADSFVRKNKALSRTLQLRGDQTLQQLHEAIFEAFDRWDQHAYEFQVGGKGPMDPKARRYVLPQAMREDFYGLGKPAGDVTRTSLADIGLKKNDAFGYWFDFGDDWWHQITVIDIGKGPAKGKCPRVIARIGPSPPQYLDEDVDSEGED